MRTKEELAVKPKTTWLRETGRLTMRKFMLTVRHDLRKRIGRPGRPDPACRVRAAPRRAPFGQGDRAGDAGQPAGGVAASQGLEGGRPRGRSAGGKSPRLLRRSRRARRVARMAR